MGEETRKDPTETGGSALNLHQPCGAWARLADSITPESRQIPS